MQTIKQIVDADVAHNAMMKKWYDENFKPLADKCKTVEEMRALHYQLLEDTCGPDGEVRSLPTLMHVEIVFAYDRVRQMEKQAKVDKALEAQ